MKKFISISLLGAASLFLVACSSSDGSKDSSSGVIEIEPSEENVIYKVTFTSNWTKTRFPTNFPTRNPHFSNLVVVTHNDQAQIWGPDVDVTSGVKEVAESGRTGTIETEIQSKLSDGEIGSFNASVDPKNTSVSLNITASPDYSLLSVITMVAPSPDWVVGVHDLALRENDDWIDSKTVQLKVYDMGTEAGSRFSINNASEAEAVQLLTTDREDTDFVDGVHFSTGDHIAELKIQRVEK